MIKVASKAIAQWWGLFVLCMHFCRKISEKVKFENRYLYACLQFNIKAWAIGFISNPLETLGCNFNHLCINFEWIVGT